MFDHVGTPFKFLPPDDGWHAEIKLSVGKRSEVFLRLQKTKRLFRAKAVCQNSKRPTQGRAIVCWKAIVASA
jgi:hypothetical protein